MYEPPTKKSRSLTAAKINAADNGNLYEKLTITQEEGYVDYSTTHLEEGLSETSKSYAKFSTKDMPQKMIATIMVSSKTRNYHICEIIHNLYEDDIFLNKKEIKFVSITVTSLIKYTSKLGQCMELIDSAVKLYHIANLNIKLDKAELKQIHDIDEQCLITLLEYHNIKIEKNTSHNSN